MLKIGDFSRLCRISIRMLRHYDSLGLLCPQKTDDFTGYRYYSEAQLPIAARIVALRGMGFGLSAIGEILEQYADPAALRALLSVQRAALQEEQEEAAQRLRLLETAIARLEKDESSMIYDVSLKTIPERYVFSVRQVIPSYDQESLLWNLLMEETKTLNLLPAQNCYSLAVFHDEGYRDSDVDVEIQGTVAGRYADTEHVKFKTVAPVQVASATYRGSYDQLTAVNQTVAAWVHDNGYEFSGAMFCIYHVSPAQTSNPEELVTEVCYPVKKK